MRVAVVALVAMLQSATTRLGMVGRAGLAGYALRMRSLIVALAILVVASAWSERLVAQEAPHVVFLVGESEYGSGETMPKFAKRLEDELHLRVTYLQSQGKELPPLEALDSADLLVMFLRFRTATDEQFARLKQWFDDGKPCVALRTTSHAFVADKQWFPQFFGGHYISHAPNHQGTISGLPDWVMEPALVRGLGYAVEMGHGGTYNAQPLSVGSRVVLLGRTGRLPAEPIAWTSIYRETSRLFYTSLGSRENFERPDFQTLLGNAVLWGLEREVPARGAFGTGTEYRLTQADTKPPPPMRAPKDATVLFDGTDLNQWQHWDPSVAPRAINIDQRAVTTGGVSVAQPGFVTHGRAMVARPGFGDLVTVQAFGNYHLHLDFALPIVSGMPTPIVKDSLHGRSGIYLAGRYEIEIAASLGQPANEFSMGAIHGQKAPDQNAAGAPGTWQSLDIHYQHKQGTHPVLSAWLNGKQIHDAVLIRERTVYGFQEPEPGAGSAASGGRARLTRSVGKSFQLGTGEFTIAARFRTKGNGTLASKCQPSGKWQPDSKALFLRGGRLVYDIGWVGQMQSPRGYNDGKWHRVLLTHSRGGARMYVDGALVCEKDDFTARDRAQHVFKIGAAADDFGGAYSGDISEVTVFERNVPVGKAQQWTRGEVVNMGEPALQWQPKKQDAQSSQPEPQQSYVRGPIRLQADSAQVRFANIWVRTLSDVDHRRLAKQDPASIARGRHVWAALCHSCHARPDQAFAGGLKNGSDPRSIFETLEKGFGAKEPMAWIQSKARYDVIHYLRQQLSLPAVSAEYLAALPAGMPPAKAIVARPKQDLPGYRRMDYGNALHWTYEVARQNIVQKGVAVRLDDGPGGVARGRAFVVYDQDTMRFAAAWTGGFIDWKGVAFDGSHNSHAHIRGERLFVAPNEPGWANPVTGSWTDERIVGRDGKRYGPLPKSWLRFLGRQQLGEDSILEYSVGTVTVREMPGLESVYGAEIVTRRLEVEASDQDLFVRLAPKSDELHVSVASRNRPGQVTAIDGWWVMRIPKGKDVGHYMLRLSKGDQRMFELAKVLHGVPDMPTREATSKAKWTETCTTKARAGEASSGYAVDELPVPDLGANPFGSWMRLGGFDFFADGKRAAVCTWNGDVWIVSGLQSELGELTWRRIGAGLFQPLGVRILDDVVYVGCRDQICVLEDYNGDGETDYYRCFNNDHQVTEHFHEFAMGLQTDKDRNFYYAKSARHALTALVPHHGTLLKVSSDGKSTEILANGFRAANGVCINDDGSFYVTDQEGHWTPKNRINRVVPGGFYGNMFGYHERTSNKDEDMEQPLCWLTNAFDRSPAELVRVVGSKWGLPEGSLLQLSYGMGRAYLVLEDQVDGVHQGGMVALPIAQFATGVMRGRFHEASGQLYCCGLYGWSGARTRPGALYRVRYVGGDTLMPTAMKVVPGGLQLTFGAELDPELAADRDSYSIKTWSLRRTKNYGSKHYDEKALQVSKAELAADRKTVTLQIPDLVPTMCIEIACDLETAGGEVLRAKIH
ncbi:MAG: type 1 glutamine amidotransferase, partial [Planctomycetota bacterium]